MTTNLSIPIFDAGASDGAAMASTRLMHILDQGPEAVLLLDAGWSCIYANGAAGQLLGLPVEQLVGQILWESLPELRESALRLRLEAAVANRSVLDTVVELPTVNQFVVAHAVPSDAGVLLLLTDASELRSTDAAIAAQERGAFIASVSHDLKNPLGAIRAQAQLLRRRLRRGTTTPEGIEQGLDMIDTTITRMTGQLNELLDVTQLDANRALELNRAPTDLVALARQSAAEYQSAARNNEIIVTADEAQVVGNWDEVRLQRVVENLLMNAIKYSPHGGPITLSIARDELEGSPAARLTVQDQGVGIPERDLPYIFERYRRGANVRGIAGTGIGLAATRLIVQQHGGVITVDSIENQGSTFTVRLPLS
ncbi:MAG TPA: ATP-binding protein [Thermomicrobiales bacterium]|jgi:signal transduction histidine kinase|nr:ATP-binding protein [Thermomicrobiales bacterium]